MNKVQYIIGFLVIGLLSVGASAGGRTQAQREMCMSANGKYRDPETQKDYPTLDACRKAQAARKSPQMTRPR